jgi:hypothetical protein
MLRIRRNQVKPRFHLALTRWKSGFTWFSAGLTFMIKLSRIGSCTLLAGPGADNSLACARPGGRARLAGRGK